LKYNTGVIFYFSWGSNDMATGNNGTNAIQHNTYLPGAIGDTAVSTSARSFNYPPSYGQSLIADMISEGITGARGYVDEPYIGAVGRPDIILKHYLAGYNLAESLYAGGLYIGWQGVVIGDPKIAPFK